MSEQQTKSALDRIADLEQAVAQLAQGFNEIRNTSGFLARDTIALQTGLSSVAKTLKASVEALKEKNILNDEDVMSRVRSVDDDNDKARLQELLQSGFLEEAPEVSSDSLVVISQKRVGTDGTILTLTNHLTVEMPQMQPNERSFMELLGKKRGEQFKLTTGDDSQFVLVRIERVFRLKDSGGVQVAAPQSDAPAEQSTSETPVEQSPEVKA